jgi:hypothetical protein
MCPYLLLNYGQGREGHLATQIPSRIINIGWSRLLLCRALERVAIRTKARFRYFHF